MSTFYWAKRECPHCGNPIEKEFAGLEQLAALFDGASRKAASIVPMAITCPHCFGMIRAMLAPTVTIISLEKLALTPMLLSDEGQLMSAAKKVYKKQAA